MPLSKQASGFHNRSLTLPSSSESHASSASVTHAIQLGTIYSVREENASKSTTNLDLQAAFSSLPSISPSRDLILELEYVKRMHQEDKDFYTREVGHLRRLLLDCEQALRDQKDGYRQQSMFLEKVVRAKEAAVAERNDLREHRKRLSTELDAKRREFSDAMDVLEATQTELDGRLKQPSDGGESRTISDLQAPMVEGYSALPGRAAALREQLVESEERFQAACFAWSRESKHQRRLSNTSTREVNNQLKRQEETMRQLLTDNEGLAAQVASMNDRLTYATKELHEKERELRASRILPLIQAQASFDDAIATVQALNAKISETAARIAAAVQPYRYRSTNTTSSDGVRWLGVPLISVLPTLLPNVEVHAPTIVHPRSHVIHQVYFRAMLANWCAYGVSAWTLVEGGGQKNGDLLSTIYRKLRTVEDPLVVARWRALSRSQLTISRASWMDSLTSALNSVLGALGLIYGEPEASLIPLLDPFLTAVRDTRRILGELVVQMELDVAVVQPGSRFNGQTMRDRVHLPSQDIASRSSATACSSEESDDLVVATLKLGLTKTSGQGQEFVILPTVLRRNTLLSGYFPLQS
ncbi:hypothetical protein FA15DRAFT_672074 [Coprinopsis marcescibilis]|uniref:Uncharacterized protein n=1 Tax=Coprinopsis marcescibilis TaxID=230819 RepID=A0A5C3KQ18_COPMA|nr:hypothetical protein FA15DRAFT_672074 [Coprinopsis marcescibilis]